MTNESAAYKLAMEHLRNCPQGVKTTALGDVLGVSMSTVHRILNLAEDEGDAHVAVPRGHSGGKGGWTPSVWKAGPGPFQLRTSRPLMPLLATTVSIPSSRTVARLVTESLRRGHLRGFLSASWELRFVRKVRQPPQPPIRSPSTVRVPLADLLDVTGSTSPTIPRPFHAQAGTAGNPSLLARATPLDG